ncbi:hypothetical protein [Aliivibrio salmonicida]|uniref:hypothetical protein n=1 Tax=Aliivibrio salmonicida TaxID=40269 RepID=UPI003D0A58D0
MALKPNTSALNRRNQNRENDKKITTTVSASNITSSTSPTTMRLPPSQKAELAIWLNELNELSQKNITPAKLMRGLIEMRRDIDEIKLLEAIHRVT